MAVRFKGKKLMVTPKAIYTIKENRDSNIVLIAGIGFLLFVPVFKTLTHLPPLMGMMLALGLMRLINSIIHKNKHNEYDEKYTVAKALQRIDT